MHVEPFRKFVANYFLFMRDNHQILERGEDDYV